MNADQQPGKRPARPTELVRVALRPDQIAALLEVERATGISVDVLISLGIERNLKRRR